MKIAVQSLSVLMNCSRLSWTVHVEGWREGFSFWLYVDCRQDCTIGMNCAPFLCYPITQEGCLQIRNQRAYSTMYNVKFNNWMSNKLTSFNIDAVLLLVMTRTGTMYGTMKHEMAMIAVVPTWCFACGCGGSWWNSSMITVATKHTRLV